MSHLTYAVIELFKGNAVMAGCKNLYVTTNVNTSLYHLLALQGFYGSFYSQISHLRPKSFGILFKRTMGVCPIFPRMLGRMLGGLGLEWTEERKYLNMINTQLAVSYLDLLSSNKESQCTLSKSLPTELLLYNVSTN